MYKNFLVLFCTYFFFIFSELSGTTASLEYEDVISLGPHCQCAWQLKVNHLRHHAYPFDFLITPFEGLLKFLVDHGVHFLEKDKLSYIATAGGGYVKDLTYDIALLHDFQFFLNSIVNYDEVKSKYNRRIRRLFDLLQTNKTILFIRQELSYEQAIILDHLLQTLFPMLTYTILALNSSESEKNVGDWGLERVKNFYLRQPIPYVWSGDDQAWKDILDRFMIKYSLPDLFQAELESFD